MHHYITKYTENGNRYVSLGKLAARQGMTIEELERQLMKGGETR